LFLAAYQDAEPQGAGGGEPDACVSAQDIHRHGPCSGAQRSAASPAPAAVTNAAEAEAAAAVAARWRCVAAAEAHIIVQRLRRQLRSERARRDASRDEEDGQPSEQLSAAARACGQLVAALCHASACRALSFPSNGLGAGGHRVDPSTRHSARECASLSQRVAEMAALAKLKGLDDDCLLALARLAPVSENSEGEGPSDSVPDLLARVRAQDAENEKLRERERERMCGRIQHGDSTDVV
jgi:hypothetical protein